MKEGLKILNLIKEILLRPKKTVVSHMLVDYSVKLIYFLIILLLILYYYLWFYIQQNITSIQLLIIGVVLMPLLAYFIIAYGLNFYRALIFSVVKFEIPFNMFKKIILPYLLTTEVIALSILFVNKVTNEYIRILIYQIPLIWFNAQVYLLAKYRICNREMDKSESLDIGKKIVVIVSILVLITVVRPYIIEYKQIEQEKQQKQLLQKESMIREEIYNTYSDVFNEVKQTMESQEYIDDVKLTTLSNKMNSIYFDINSAPTNLEKDLKVYIETMINTNRVWYQAKKEGNEEIVKIQLEKYYDAENKAAYIMDNYLSEKW